MLTAFRKPEGGELPDWQKEFNKQINQIRYVIEQVIANFKTWRIMHTDYRRPIETFPTTISAVIGLHFFKKGEKTPLLGGGGGGGRPAENRKKVSGGGVGRPRREEV